MDTDEIKGELDKTNDTLKDHSEYIAANGARSTELWKHQDEFNHDIKKQMETVTMKTNTLAAQVLTMTALGVMIGTVLTLIATPLVSGMLGG